MAFSFFFFFFFFFFRLFVEWFLKVKKGVLMFFGWIWMVVLNREAKNKNVTHLCLVC